MFYILYIESCLFNMQCLLLFIRFLELSVLDHTICELILYHVMLNVCYMVHIILYNVMLNVCYMVHIICIMLS